MTLPIIEIEGLGKKYQIGANREKYLSLRDQLAKTTHGLLRHFRAKHHHVPSTEDFWALRDVSFSVQEGEAVGIIGRNGAGKSTLLKILSQITPPTEGKITCRGRIASLLEVGTGFHPELTGRENIYLNGAILGMTRAEIKRKFDEIVSFAEVDKFLDTPVKRYSSGMYVRLAFAVAAHLEPEILVVDEVLAVGDMQFQQKCLGKMGEVAKSGRTVLFVTHNMAALQQLCGSAILLASGHLDSVGPSSTIISRYAQSGEDTPLSWQRTEPATTDVYYERIWLADNNNKPITVVTTGEGCKTILEFRVCRSIQGLRISMDLLDSTGMMIFASSPLDFQVKQPESAGFYKAEVTLPPDLLLAKPYRIRTTLYHNTSGVFDRVESIQFKTQETLSLSSNSPGGRNGLVGVRCPWSMAWSESEMSPKVSLPAFNHVAYIAKTSV